MTTTLLHSGMVLCLGLADTIYDNGYVVIEDERIIDVGDGRAMPALSSFDQVMDCTGKLIMPGLVNAHTHTPMILFRGMAEGVSLLTLDGWLKAIRSLEEVITPDMVPPAVEVACGEMIRTGTTTFADQYFFTDQIIPVVKKSGMRAVLAYGIVELGDPTARERELNHLEAFLEEIGGDETDRVRGWVGPHAFFVDNSIQMMETQRKIAKKFQAGMHIHISTTGEEDDIAQSQFNMSAVQKMHDMGMFDVPIIAAHAITIPESDWDLLSQQDFTAIIAASACMRAGVEAAPVVGMRNAGIRVAIGTDNVCNNNDYDLFLEMRTLAKLTKFREKRPDAITAREVIDMATRAGAEALGLGDKIGELAAGKKADVIILNQNEIGWSPFHTNDPFTPLVYSVNGLHVTDVMVDGQWLLRNREWTTIDMPSAVKALNKHVVELQKLAKRI